MMQRFFKKLSKRFLCQSGEIIITTLVITGLVSLGVSLYTLGKKSEELKKNVPAWQYADQQDSPDAVNLGELYDKQNAQLVKFAVEGGETAVGTGDDTGFLSVLKYFGVFKAKDKKQDDSAKKDIKEEQNIKEQLQDKKLPDDKLMVDTAKVIKKQIIKHAVKNTPEEDIDKLLYDTLIIVQEKSEKAIKQAEMAKEASDIEDELDEIEDIAIIESIAQSLKDKESLEEAEVIKLKTQLSRLESEKNYLEEKLASYKYYEEKGYIVTDTSGLTGLQDRLDDVNNKISQTAGQIENIEIEKQKEETEQTAKTTKETTATTAAPTISLTITQGPTFSAQDKVCYYRVTANVAGYPEPEITFSRDDSSGAWGAKTVQINLKDNKSYILTATAKNSEGQATDSITLNWGCEKVLLGSVSLSGKGTLTGQLDTDQYNIKMTINLDTGKITGNINFTGTALLYYTETDPDTGEQTQVPVYCDFGYSSSLSGSMNLATRAINATSSGYLRPTSGGVCSSASSKYISITLNGTLNESATFASGTDHSGDYWSVSK